MNHRAQKHRTQQLKISTFDQMRNLLIIIIFSFASTVNAQQSFILKGHVKDKETSEPLSKVNIYLNETMRGSTSNDDGYFEITIDKLPALIVFSRVGHTRRFFNLTKRPGADFNVPLQKSIHEIPEVEITAKRRAVNISSQHDMYVVDYDFYDDHVLLLGHPGKRSRDVHLMLMDRMGKLLIRKEIRAGVNIYRDPFNNLHILAPDSAYQLYFDENDIQLLYPTDRASFIKAFPEFLKVYNDKIILRQFAFEDQALMYYFYQPSDSTVNRIWAQATAEIYRKVEGWMSRIRISSTGKSTTNFDLFNADERFIKMAFYAPIFCPLEIIKDTLYVFNFNNGLIETIGPEGYPVKTPTLMNFYTDPGWQKKLYNDVVTDKVYTQYLDKGITILREVNVNTGLLENEEIRIPDFPYINKILIHGGNLYFLYQEKQYPRFQRLYRMQL